jgi:hypothetical protein
MSDRRGLITALGCCVAAGAVALIAAGRAWRHGTFVAITGQRVSLVVTGHAAEPALPALAIALMVMAGAVLASRGRLRRLVGLLVVVIGGSVIAVAVASRGDGATALRRQASVHAVTHASIGPTISTWAVVTVVSGIVAVAAGALTVVAGARWPALGARYDAPTAHNAGERVSDWDVLDRGEDPTV